MEARILLTGATGFVGPRLLNELQAGAFRQAQFLVWDYRPESMESDLSTNIDICSAEAVSASVADFRPTHVIHLAAQSHVPTSFQKPELTWRINVLGTLNLFEAVKKYAPQAGILYISSSEVYGRSFQAGKPLDENALLQPQNPYAASKAAADLMAGQYATQGLRVIRLRPFNHIGPGQREEFVASAFAAQIARIEAGQQKPILSVGNLDAQRDFLDVDDVVHAYVKALESVQSLAPGLVLNICSGHSVSIQGLLNILLKQSSCDIRVEPDPSKMRPSDTPVAAGCAVAALNSLNWKAQISLEDTLKSVLHDWRQIVDDNGNV